MADIEALVADLRAEQESLDQVLAELDDAGWRTSTPAEGWTVAHQVAHLAYFDGAVTRAITHLIKDESGSSGGGGITIGGKHLHHYNLGILTLSALAGATISRGAKAWEGPAGPILYGVANALIVDEAALLLDLEDVYWGKQGRVSVDAAITTIGAGGVAVAALPLAQKWTGRA